MDQVFRLLDAGKGGGWIRQGLEDQGRIPGVILRPVEGAVLINGNLQLAHNGIQGLCSLVASDETVDFLQVVVENGYREGQLHAVINHVSLKFREIHGSPGAEGVIVSAPCEEFFHHVQEILTLLTELIHGQVGDFGYFLM